MKTINTLVPYSHLLCTWIRRQILPGMVLFAGISLPVTAQDTVGDGSTVVYPASYFTQYAPVSAQDMISRIPGAGNVTGRGGPPGGGGNPGSGGRGLGSGRGDEVLINGKRTAGKNNETSSVLQRITADQVDYIEIIRGTSGTLDVRGSSQIINVVTFEELASNSISYEANMDRYADHEVHPGGQERKCCAISVSWSDVRRNVAIPNYGRRVSQGEMVDVRSG